MIFYSTSETGYIRRACTSAKAQLSSNETTFLNSLDPDFFVGSALNCNTFPSPGSKYNVPGGDHKCLSSARSTIYNLYLFHSHLWNNSQWITFLNSQWLWICMSVSKKLLLPFRFGRGAGESSLFMSCQSGWRTTITSCMDIDPQCPPFEPVLEVSSEFTLKQETSGLTC